MWKREKVLNQEDGEQGEKVKEEEGRGKTTRRKELKTLPTWERGHPAEGRREKWNQAIS